MYDYLVVGSGLYGATFAQQAKAHGKSVLVIDKRPNIAGNIYTEKVEGINFHKYGAHIFHTNNKEVWDYLQQFTVFNRFTNSPVANYKGELYSIIEHKWFEFGKDENGNDLPKTIISREYSSEWKPGDEPYYPVNDAKNGALYTQYKKLADQETDVIFGGRLGEYKYYDMDAVVASALAMSKRELRL